MRLDILLCDVGWKRQLKGQDTSTVGVNICDIFYLVPVDRYVEPEQILPLSQDLTLISSAREVQCPAASTEVPTLLFQMPFPSSVLSAAESCYSLRPSFCGLVSQPNDDGQRERESTNSESSSLIKGVPLICRVHSATLGCLGYLCR